MGQEVTSEEIDISNVNPCDEKVNENVNLAENVRDTLKRCSECTIAPCLGGNPKFNTT